MITRNRDYLFVRELGWRGDAIELNKGSDSLGRGPPLSWTKAAIHSDEDLRWVGQRPRLSWTKAAIELDIGRDRVEQRQRFTRTRTSVELDKGHELSWTKATIELDKGRELSWTKATIELDEDLRWVGQGPQGRNKSRWSICADLGPPFLGQHSRPCLSSQNEKARHGLSQIFLSIFSLGSVQPPHYGVQPPATN